MSRLTKFFNILSGFTIILAAILLIVAMYWAVIPVNVISIKSPFKVITKSVNPGGTLVYELNYCKYQPIPALLTKVFVDDILYSTPAVASNLPVGCHTTRAEIDIPNTLPAHFYQVKLLYHYQVNPLRTQDIEIVSEPFTIGTPPAAEHDFQ